MLGLPATDPATYRWEPVRPGDDDYLPPARRLLHAVADRLHWQTAPAEETALAEARRRAHDTHADDLAAAGRQLDGTAKLRQHYIQPAERKIAAGPAWRDHGLIFASDTGAPLDTENFSRAFAKLRNTAGLGHWHPHELRHSGASLMLAQGTPLHVVSENLGHASITITKDVCTGGLSGTVQQWPPAEPMFQTCALRRQLAMGLAAVDPAARLCRLTRSRDLGYHVRVFEHAQCAR